MARPRHPSPADRAGDHGHDDGDDHGDDDNHALSLLLPWISGPFCILHQLSSSFNNTILSLLKHLPLKHRTPFFKLITPLFL